MIGSEDRSVRFGRLDYSTDYSWWDLPFSVSCGNPTYQEISLITTRVLTRNIGTPLGLSPVSLGGKRLLR